VQQCFTLAQFSREGSSLPSPSPDSYLTLHRIWKSATHNQNGGNPRYGMIEYRVDGVASNAKVAIDNDDAVT